MVNQVPKIPRERAIELYNSGLSVRGVEEALRAEKIYTGSKSSVSNWIKQEQSRAKAAIEKGGHAKIRSRARGDATPPPRTRYVEGRDLNTTAERPPREERAPLEVPDLADVDLVTLPAEKLLKMACLFERRLAETLEEASPDPQTVTALSKEFGRISQALFACRPVEAMDPERDPLNREASDLLIEKLAELVSRAEKKTETENVPA